MRLPFRFGSGVVPASPEGWPAVSPSPLPVRPAIPKDGCASGYRTHPRPFRVFRAAAPAQTGAGGSELNTCSVSEAISIVAHVVGSGHSAPFPARRSVPSESPNVSSYRPAVHFRYGRPAAVLDRSVFTADRQGFPVPAASATGRFFRPPEPGRSRDGEPVSPGAAASLPSRRERLASRRLAPPIRPNAPSDDAPKRLACTIRPVVRSAFAILPDRATPLALKGQSPLSVEGRSPPDPLEPGGAGDSPRFSSRIPVPL